MHTPTGRTVDVVLVQRLNDPKLLAQKASESFVLLVVGDDRLPAISHADARSLIDRGARYVCAWGPHCADLEEAFDYGGFLPECGPELPFTLMTTSHQSETLDETLNFAFYKAQSPEEWGSELGPVIVAAANEDLRDQCLAWLEEENRES